MVESTAVSYIHPDKHNNSVDRIISKEEEREDPRRDSSIYLRVQNTVVFPHFYKNYKISLNTVYSTVFPHAIQQLQVSTINSTYRINSSPRNTTTTRLIPCRLLPATVPRVSKHSTWQNKAPNSLTVFQGHTAEAGFQLILPGRNSILSGRQHPRTPYSNSQANFTGIHLVLQRILPGEIGFIPKGQVLYVHAILRSVCSNLLILVLRIILQEY